MAADAKPSVFGSAIGGWQDGFTALRRMPAVTAITFGTLLLLQIARLYLLPYVLPSADAVAGFARPLAGLAFEILQIFVLTPLAIAVHRHVLLGEVTTRYALNPSQKRLRRFFLFVVLMVVLMGIVSISIELISAMRLQTPTQITLQLAGIVLVIAAVIVLVRMAILFPAIAADAPGAGWRNAMRDSKGYFWRVLLSVLLTFLPVIAVAAIAVGLAVSLRLPGQVIAITAVFILPTALLLVGMALFAAVTSGLYRAITGRLGHLSRLREAATPA